MILKGLNRRSFEARLETIVRRRLEGLGDFSVRSAQSVIYVEPRGAACDMDAAFRAMADVFGVVSLSRAIRCGKTLGDIFDAAREYLGGELLRARSFKVETKRADKRFPMTSIAVSQELGGRLADMYPDCAVDVHAPELTVSVELREDFAFVHGNPARGAGGLPPGTAGRAVALLSGGIDSPVAVYLAARRGLHIIPAHFYAYPYTSEAAKNKVVELAKILTRYCGRLTVELIPFARVQEEIAKKCPEEFGTIITRRFMVAIAERIALQNGAGALVTGENLGQVASQTLESIAVTEARATLPILRPLICHDKREIIELAARIGTYDTSVLPFEDCCTVFTPRRPSTRPKLHRILDAERALDADALITDAAAAIERVTVG
jgi:thiamine biosynthesis protein ThiI